MYVLETEPSTVSVQSWICTCARMYVLVGMGVLNVELSAVSVHSDFHTAKTWRVITYVH